MTIGLYHCLVDYLDFVLFMPVYILTLRRRFFLFFQVGILPKFPDDAFVPLGLHYMRRFYASFPTLFLGIYWPTCGCHHDAIFFFSSILLFFYVISEFMAGFYRHENIAEKLQWRNDYEQYSTGGYLVT